MKNLKKKVLNNKIISEIAYFVASHSFLVKVRSNKFMGIVSAKLFNRWNKKCYRFLLSTKSQLKNNYFLVHGNHNEIFIGENCNIHGVTFEIVGRHTKIIIGNNVSIRGTIIHMGDENSTLTIGDKTDIGPRTSILVLESESILIGQDCMFSTDIQIRVSDDHSIIDLDTGNRYNKAISVNIGDHVWLGAGVTCLKGVVIEDNVIIGNRSLLTKGKYNSNCVYAGTPARLIKENVNWIRERIACE